MGRNRRLTIAGLVATMVATAMSAVALIASPAAADIAGPTFATSSNGSDPHIITCTDNVTGVNGYCLYTSQDMGQQYAYPNANWYPMRDTRAYFSPNGYNQWVSKGVVFTENKLDGWVPRRNCTGGQYNNPASGDTLGNCRAYHLWAPSAVRVGNDYYLYVPDVSDVSDDAAPNIHTSSRIAVAKSTGSPWGPFNFLGTVPNQSGYMSDPDVVVEGTNNHIIWADGDFDTCGGFKYAKLNSSDMRTLQSGTTQTLTINGLSALGNCTPAGSSTPVGRPYVEGGSLYKRYFSPQRGWTLIFAAKPSFVPTQCSTTFGGPGTDNSVIAWASASAAQGPYTYEGIIMCGSTTEWTNQATLATTTNNRLIIISHDGVNKDRKLHAECLFTGFGVIGQVYPQPLNATYGFDYCSTQGAGYGALWVRDGQFPNAPRIVSTTNGNGDLVANRYAIGPWERYALEFNSSANAYQIRALANGRLVCAPNAFTPLAPTCQSPAPTTALFDKENQPMTDQFLLKSRTTGQYFSIGSTGKLYADSNASGAAVFVFLKYAPS